MRNPLSLAGTLRPLPYALMVPLLILLQHGAVALCYRANGAVLQPDAMFWWLPLRRLATLPGVTSTQAALVFALALVSAWVLTALSYRRASWARRGHGLALFAIFPALQVIAAALLVVMPRRAAEPEPLPQPVGARLPAVLQGVLAGAAIIVFAVLISAVVFGVYGWGLFVMTPFMAGFATAWIANHAAPMSMGRTMAHVVSAGGLGAAMLLLTALEGLICIILLVPLGVFAAMLGGALGRAVALLRHRGTKPLMAVAVLPSLFAVEAAMPPAVPLVTAEHIDVAAPPQAVWRAITGEEPIVPPPGVVGRLGFAYPVSSRLIGEGVGAVRLGQFSTGAARERVTQWRPGARLAFTVLAEPPAMAEMSFYEKVHAPHRYGYSAGDTRFVITPLPGGRSRLTLEAEHVLRIDPVLYWQPLATWAIRANVRRVLLDAKTKAERLARR